MAELFKTVLILSLLGFALTAVLLCIKPLTARKFPAKWQYYIWITVMFCMIVPIYKLIPEAPVKIIDMPTGEDILNITVVPSSPDVQTSDNHPEISDQKQEQKLDLADILVVTMRYFPYIWILGGCIYLAVAFSSYALYLSQKRKKSFVTENSVFESVRQELGIKRKIPLRVADDISSPVLVGVFFPKVYVPQEKIDDEKARMVFLHELTHYKRRDLVLKWFSLFVNAIHWFNPFSYLLCRNLSDACEVSCDVAVTKNMTEDEQKLYMKTILDFAR